MPPSDGAALVAAAVRAACAAKAPRRTVAAVAAAVASTVLRPVDVTAAPPTSSPTKPARASGGEEATEAELVERLRQSRADRRRIKRQRRRAAKAAAAAAVNKEQLEPESALGATVGESAEPREDTDMGVEESKPGEVEAPLEAQERLEAGGEGRGRTMDMGKHVKEARKASASQASALSVLSAHSAECDWEDPPPALKEGPPCDMRGRRPGQQSKAKAPRKGDRACGASRGRRGPY
ncbi:unnamed protein product [Effrenium voratum]|uniref:Uncharacterized protein n=1 Tax=Effrenium voratum TaxID=2562239 RepID=A0AA36HVC8_9DINO|nr:unnamed protein product [Effrenium voratum]CAJ1415270.1 unnamed protein product [Effrenium voratum]